MTLRVKKIWLAMVLAGVSELALVGAPYAAPRDNARLCDTYKTAIDELVVRLKNTPDAEDRSDLIAEFLKKNPKAESCLGSNDQMASILSDVEPAAGDEGPGEDPVTVEPEPENPQQLGENPPADPTPPAGDSGDGKGEGGDGDGPVGDGPVGDGPIGDGPIGDGPIGDGPIGDGPIGDGPVGDGGKGPIRD